MHHETLIPSEAGRFHRWVYQSSLEPKGASNMPLCCNPISVSLYVIHTFDQRAQWTCTALIITGKIACPTEKPGSSIGRGAASEATGSTSKLQLAKSFFNSALLIVSFTKLEHTWVKVVRVCRLGSVPRRTAAGQGGLYRGAHAGVPHRPRAGPGSHAGPAVHPPAGELRATGGSPGAGLGTESAGQPRA